MTAVFLLALGDATRYKAAIETGDTQMTSYSDEFGTTTISSPARTRRLSLSQLKAGGWRDMNRSGCHGEWRRDTTSTDTHTVTEVYSGATIRIIEWRAAA